MFIQFQKFQIIITIGLVFLAMTMLLPLTLEFNRARLKALDKLSPNAFNEILDASLNRAALKPARLKAYLNYARKILRNDPSRADALALSGYCRYHLGQVDQALQDYLKAAELGPNFFSFHYHLAVIYFNLGQHEKSVEALGRALKCDPKESLVYMLTVVKIHGNLLIARVKTYGEPVELQMKMGYQKAYQLLMMNQARLTNGGAAASREIIPLEIF